MTLRVPRASLPAAAWVAGATVVLLALRFFSDVGLVAVNPPPEVQASVGEFFEAYEAVLPFALLPVTFLLVWSGPRSPPATLWLVLLVFHTLAVVLGTAFLRSYGPKDFFPPVAMAVVASGSLLSLLVAPGPRGLARQWWGASYLALLALVPVVFAMRVAALLGFGTAPGEGGVLQGNWLLVNLPTISLELLAVAVWLGGLMEKRPSEVRERWYAFLPFVAVPLFAVGFVARPLVGFILSATISWGSNLAVFVPPAVSLTLAVAAVACFTSTFLLVPRKSRRDAWNLLLLGSLTVLLAGFQLSMASVEALTLGLVLIGIALSSWPRPAS